LKSQLVLKFYKITSVLWKIIQSVTGCRPNTQCFFVGERTFSEFYPCLYLSFNICMSCCWIDLQFLLQCDNRTKITGCFSNAGKKLINMY